jgi:hypothetical protein
MLLFASVATAQLNRSNPPDTCKFVSLDFEFERGSFIATYKDSDEKLFMIQIIGPKDPEKIANVRIEKSELVGTSWNFNRLSRAQCREFVVSRLCGSEELTRIERDFLSVLLIQSQRVAPIRHFGMGGFAEIKEGNWEAVFRDPKQKAVGKAFGDAHNQ